MFIFKRKPSLSQLDLEEMKKFVGQTIVAMLSTKEETMNVLKKYDLVLIFSWEGDYIQGSIFQLSTFNMAKNGLSSLINTPLYTETRYFINTNDSVKYIDDDEIKGLSPKNLVAFYSICELIRIFEIEVHSSNAYTCVW